MLLYVALIGGTVGAYGEMSHCLRLLVSAQFAIAQAGQQTPIQAIVIHLLELFHDTSS
jgi:hypothetical protein